MGGTATVDTVSRPFAVLGVLSGTTLPGMKEHYGQSSDGARAGARYDARRESIRTSWMQFENVQRSFVVRFVLRCGGL